MKTIVFDMDNVLADFDITTPNALERFKSEENFFTNLKPIKRNYLILRRLIKKNVPIKILSASPNEMGDNDKIKWLNKYVPNLKREDMIFCRLGENKALYLNPNNTILIDDYTFNLVNWKNGGGECLKYFNGINCIKNTHKDHNIKELKSFSQLYSLVA